MTLEPRRPMAVGGSWYPADPRGLAREVDRHLASADVPLKGELRALIAPHAGLMYSGPVAAFSYRQLVGRAYDAIVMVGPSHFIGFDGVALYPHGSFASPFGDVKVDETLGSSIARAASTVGEVPAAHRKEHSLEMQLPFVAHLSPGTPIVPLVMGYQSRETVADLARGLASALAGANVLLVASSDLSHYHEASAAARLDGRVIDCVSKFEDAALMTALEAFPEHACGGGPMVAVMSAAKALGARDARILKYADSGDVSGDKSAVVGYLAAAMGTFT